MSLPLSRQGYERVFSLGFRQGRMIGVGIGVTVTAFLGVALVVMIAIVWKI